MNKLLISAVVFALLALGFLAVGCSAKSDFEKICNAETLSGVGSEPDPSTRAMKMAQWISENIHSSDAKRALSGIATVAPDQKGAVLKQAALEAGYTGPCPMADAK